jgi:hypothetical protein
MCCPPCSTPGTPCPARPPHPLARRRGHPPPREGELEQPLRLGRNAERAARPRRGRAKALDDVHADRLRPDPERLQRAGGHLLGLSEQAEEQMLRPDVVTWPSARASAAALANTAPAASSSPGGHVWSGAAAMVTKRCCAACLVTPSVLLISVQLQPAARASCTKWSTSSSAMLRTRSPSSTAAANRLRGDAPSRCDSTAPTRRSSVGSGCTASTLN